MIPTGNAAAAPEFSAGASVPALRVPELFVLVTGANGWIGRSLCVALARSGHSVCGLVRKPGGVPPGVAEWVHAQPDFEALDSARLAAGNFDVVVHTAARAHVTDDRERDPLAAYRATNVDGTRRLVAACRDAGIGRFVYLSSIKALGETEPGRPWREDDAPSDAPGTLDAYGRSKHEAERLLMELSDASFRTTVVRPPLVYGPGVRANFLKLVALVDRERPLPLGCATAPRSMVALGNVTDALVRCIEHADSPAGSKSSAPGPAARRQTIFHVADREPVSVRDLVMKIGALLGKKPALWPVPVFCLRLAGMLSGRSHQIDRLTLPLRVETGAIRLALGWEPPLSTDAALTETIAWYRSNRARK